MLNGGPRWQPAAAALHDGTGWRRAAWLHFLLIIEINPASVRNAHNQVLIKFSTQQLNTNRRIHIKKKQT
jgi:hypothetical protein